MKKLFALILLLTFIAQASAGDVFISSAGQDIPVPAMTRTTQGQWHYEVRYANGTRALMNAWISPSAWTANGGATGFVYNASSGLVGVENGKTIIVDTQAPGDGAGNVSVTFVANFTGSARLFGWDKQIITGLTHNFTLWRNGNLIRSYSVGVGVNQSFDMGASVTAGDNLSFEFADPFGTYLEQYANLSITVFNNDTTTITTAITNPVNNTVNASIVFPIEYTTSSAYYIKNSSVWTNATGWLSVLDNSSNIGTGVNWLNITFPSAGAYRYAVRVCNGVNDCNFSLNNTVFIITTLGADIYTPGNNSVNTTLVQPFGYVPNSTYGIVNESIFYNVTGWIRIAGNTSVVNNGSLNWINVTFPAFGLYKVALQTCDVYSICNFSSNFTINITTPRIVIRAFNESNPAIQIFFNVTVGNATNSTYYPPNTFWFNKTRGETPTGSLTFTLGNSTANFGTRYYYADFNGTDVNFSVYLLPFSLGYEVDITLKDYAGTLLTGYFVSAQRSFNGTQNYTTVEQTAIGYGGQGIMHLDITDPNYRFAVYDQNKNFVQAFSPIILDASRLLSGTTNVYTVILTLNSQTFDIIGEYNQVTANCGFTNSTQMLSCTVYDNSQSNRNYNLTIMNLTGSGFQQICSNYTTGYDFVITCQNPSWNNTYFSYQLILYNPDTSVFIASQGSFDYRSKAINWGNAGYLITMLFVVAVFALLSFNMNAALAGAAATFTLSYLLGVFNVPFEGLVGIYLLVGLLIWKSRG